MGRTVVALLLAGLVLGTGMPGALALDDELHEEPGPAASLGWGMAAIGTNLGYMPAKMLYALGGGLVGLMAWGGRHLQQEYGQEPQCILTMPLLEGLDGVEKMSKSKNNYIGINEDANTMFAKVLSISDDLMWRWYTLLSFRSEADIAALKGEIAAGRNPKDAKVMLAKEITSRFHSAQAADAAEQDFINRSKGGVPDDIPEVQLGGAPLGIGALLKQAGLAPSTSEANRLIDGGGVRVDSSVVSDKSLKLEPGTYVLQVGKRKFAKVTLA